MCSRSGFMKLTDDAVLSPMKATLVGFLPEPFSRQFHDHRQFFLGLTVGGRRGLEYVYLKPRPVIRSE